MPRPQGRDKKGCRAGTLGIPAAQAQEGRFIWQLVGVLAT